MDLTYPQVYQQAVDNLVDYCSPNVHLNLWGIDTNRWYFSLVEIKRPTITQVSDAPIGSTLEMWRNKEIATPETWVKIDRFTWRNVTTPSALLKGNRGLELSTKYRVILQLGKEMK